MIATYLDILISTSYENQIREILPSLLADFGFEGFLEEDLGVHCYIPKHLWDTSIENEINETIKELHLPPITYVSIKEIQNKNWNEEWEKSLQPITVSDRIIVTPSWHSVTTPDKIVITIDPKMTFGTGYHETTRLVIRLMEHYIKSTSTVLDIGTGTGILAIAAIKLGAKHAIGIDIDELSLDNGVENTLKNNVSEKVEIRIGSVETITEPSFEIIVANLIRNTILELLEPILAKLATNGTVIFSGLLQTDKSEIEKTLQLHGYSIKLVVKENEWIALAAGKPQP